ncbi:AMP-binding protein [Actinokineospora auranticolor]|uniref:Amino acid adenylation domain-containing protein n=1 Tax=Actinokineospora auranticolor TaxID=155976 RepID=A0A2S6GJ60_9PSEU|nr:AMP-binding protein [Actinokineospora auranticolor]PPK65223.1 amino acid adenylation domain-containing protein [Actinokineospora auranticolor]
MKLSNIALWEDDSEPGARPPTATESPGERTAGALITEQAAATPDAVAVVDGAARHTYADLIADADRLAGFLAEHGVGPGAHVGVLLRRSYRLVVALVAVLKAGGSYVPLNPDLPDARLHSLVRDTRPLVIVSERALTGTCNELFWNSPDTAASLCVDSPDVLRELEPAGTRMSLELWNYVADHADDPVAANGWRSPYTGARISDEALDRYVRATAGKIADYLSPDATMLEIGCGTGTTLKGLAPLVGRYVGIDPSAGVLRWAHRARAEHGLDNVALHELGALNLNELPAESAGPFDAVVFNSVVQSFGGVNYLRAVLGEAIGRVGARGVVYLGHVWDAARREGFLAEVAARHRAEHGGRPLSAADALFLPTAFFEDLPHHFPEVTRVEAAPMAFHDDHLTGYAYDVLLHIDRTTPRAPARVHKRQYDRRALDTRPATPVADRHDPDATAYVIQTSGSTGTPKSVEVGMRGLVNLLRWYRDACEMGPDTRVLQTITCGFDASVKNYLAPLISGASVVLAPDSAYDPRDLLALLEAQRVTVLNPGVPSAVYPLIDVAAAAGFRPLRSLRHLALGGETPDLARLRDWVASGECRATLLNIYGPTEATDISCAAVIDPARVGSSGPVPIGRPIPNARAHVLDSELREVPVGVVGELWLAGIGLAKGYLGDPALTEEKFGTRAPALPGERLYRTGDLARRLPGGDLVVSGRADTQVKLLGHRVELGEVEQCLRSLPGVRDAAGAVRPVPGTDELRLCGYVIPDPGAAPDPLSLRAALGRFLPAAAVPVDVVIMADWPRMPNGKLDRNALPTPEQVRRAAARPPATETERVLLDLWREVLADESACLDDNFFVVGGHSLGAALLAIRIRDVLRREVSIVDVYRAQTAAALARLIDRRPAAHSPLKLLAEGDGAATVYCFPPIAGYAWAMAGFAQHLGFRVYGFDFPGGEDPAASAADLMTATRASGPRFLVGYSAGGVLATATAAALRERGERVDGIVVLDSEPPGTPVPIGTGEVAAMVREVLDDPHLTAHVHQTGADRVTDTVARYARWHAAARPAGRVPCDLLLLTAADGDPGWIAGWRDLVTGDSRVQPAVGGHTDLLSGTNAVANADPVRTWLAQRSTTTGRVRMIGPGIPQVTP